mmetsp:Transcript_44348/g.126580  ORF Transcript_44348/g.126580 Transcript_44348/m.126580 type:complete len:253 (-) Transcript_44348:185-943(-)
MAWRASRGRSNTMEQEGEEQRPAGKKPKAREEAEGAKGSSSSKAEHRLLRQLESRVRSLEYQAGFTMFFEADHKLVKALLNAQKEYAEKAKAKEGEMLAPHLMSFDALVSALLGLLPKGLSVDLRHLTGALERISELMDRTEPHEVEQWVKACGCSLTYANAKGRIYVDVRGQLVVAKPRVAKEVAEALYEQAKEAGEAGEGLRSTLELSLPLPAEGKVVEVSAILFALMRSVGGSSKSGRAPKGNLARQLD